MKYSRMKSLSPILCMAALLPVWMRCSDSGSKRGHEAGETNPVCTAEGEARVVQAPVLVRTYPASWDENWFGSPAFADLDGDGENEVIAGRHSVLYVWKASGDLLWRAPMGQDASSPDDHASARQYAAPAIGDFDHDGMLEIATAYSHFIAVYKNDGSFAPGWPVSFPDSESEIRSVAAADLDHDGFWEIAAVKTSDGPVAVVFDHQGRVLDGWPQVDCEGCYDYGGYNQNIGLADIAGDGDLEVIATYDCSYIGFFTRTGEALPAHPDLHGDVIPSVPMFHDWALQVQGWGPDGEDRDEFTDSPPAFGDIDGDGRLEIVLYSDHERAGEYKNRGNCLWVLEADLSRVPGFEWPICSGGPIFEGYKDNIVQVAPVPAVADIQGDSRPEIIVPSYDGLMRAYSPDGEELWAVEFDSPGGSFIGASGAVVADLNGDGRPEVIFATYSMDEGRSHLYIVSAGGAVLQKIPLEKRGSMSPPTVGDVDGDGQLDILLSLKDTLGGGLGGVQLWTVPGAGTACIPWPTGRANMARTGAALPPENR